MEIEILTDTEAAKGVKTTDARKEYPIKGKITWKSDKSPEKFAFEEKAGADAGWEAYIRSELEGEKGKKVALPSFPFAIIATGFKLGKVDTVNKEYWESSLALDSRTDFLTIWHNKEKIFEGSYTEAKAKFAADNTVKYKTCIIAVSLNKGQLVEIEAGGLLVESLCIDAKAFLGKTVKIFALASTPPLIFLPNGVRRLQKEGQLFTKDSKGECFFSPVTKVGILPAGEMLDNVLAKKQEFEEWAAEAIKKIGKAEDSAKLPETDHDNAEFNQAHEEKRKANELAIKSQAPQVVPTDGITVPPTNDISHLDDSDQLPF